MNYSYLQHLPSCKQIYPKDLTIYYASVDSWALAFPLITFKLVWKAATLVALVTAQDGSDVILLHIDNQNLFLQHHAAIFPASGGKIDQLGHLPPQIHIDCHHDAHLCTVFYLKAYLCCTEPFRKKLDGSCVYSLILYNKRQHMLIHATTISSWD